MRALFCGSRDWNDPRPIELIFAGLVASVPDRLTIITGGARGADTIAAEIALKAAVTRAARPEVCSHVFHADWRSHGKGAGPIRNQQMLDSGQPDVVFAFTDDLARSRGTADMVRRARKAGLPVYVIGRAGSS